MDDINMGEWAIAKHTYQAILQGRVVDDEKLAIAQPIIDRIFEQGRSQGKTDAQIIAELSEGDGEMVL